MSIRIQETKLNGSMMNFAFRVDASAEIGTGHFGRCFTLAKKLRKAGHSVLFICRHIPANLIGLIRDAECEIAILDGKEDARSSGDLYHSSWLGVSQELDASQCIRELKHLDERLDWLIVDHYSLDSRWESKLKVYAKRVCVIDDLADRQHDCNLLIDQNLYKNPHSRYSNLVPEDCQLMLGPDFAILRDEFKNLKKIVKNHDGSLKKIVIFFGGSDLHNFTGITVSALGELGLDGITVDVVVGNLHPEIKMIQARCEELKYILHVQTESIGAIFLSADLCIGGGGVTTWERCCLGLPSLIVSIGRNQIQIAKDLDMVQGCKYLGHASSVTKEIIQENIKVLINHPNLLKVISKKGYSLVDGLGTDKVFSILSDKK